MAVVALVAMVACGGNTENANLENTYWKLVEMEGITAETINAEEDAFVLTFASEAGEFSGRTNCNRFFGTYELKDGELSMGNAGATRMACPDMQSEASFLQMLSQVKGYSIKGTELTLTGADKKALAVFRAAPQARGEVGEQAACGKSCEGCPSKCEGEQECGEMKSCDGEQKCDGLQACGEKKSCEGKQACGEKKSCDGQQACGEKKECGGCPSKK